MKKTTKPKTASIKKTTRLNAAGRVESNTALKPLVVDKTDVDKLKRFSHYNKNSLLAQIGLSLRISQIQEEAGGEMFFSR